jgi:hypothetical protein
MAPLVQLVVDTILPESTPGRRWSPAAVGQFSRLRDYGRLSEYRVSETLYFLITCEALATASQTQAAQETQ